MKAVPSHVNLKAWWWVEIFVCVFKVFEEYFRDCSFFHTCQIIGFLVFEWRFFCNTWAMCVYVCLCMHALMTDVVVVMCLQYLLILVTGNCSTGLPTHFSGAGKHIPLNPPTFHAWFKLKMQDEVHNWRHVWKGPSYRYR